MTKTELIAERDEVRGQYETNRRHQVSLAVKFDALEKQIENYVDEPNVRRFKYGEKIIDCDGDSGIALEWRESENEYEISSEHCESQWMDDSDLNPCSRLLEIFKHDGGDRPEHVKEGAMMNVFYRGNIKKDDVESGSVDWNRVAWYAFSPSWMK